ncbi:MAG: hypothetical protein R3A44_39010 [Caldilineaceae bacterium]
MLVSDSVESQNVTPAFVTALRTAAVPVIVWESGLFDELEMTGASKPADQGTLGSQTHLNMVAANSSHPLSAGLSGTVLVNSASSGRTFHYGVPPAGAMRIATSLDDANKALVFAYEVNATMMPGATAPARRVGFFSGDAPYFPLENGAAYSGPTWALFGVAVDWAKSCTATSPTPTPGGPTPTPGGPLAITNIVWGEVYRANPTTGADNWPATWGDDGLLYTAFGDGDGFASGTKWSLGLAAVSGEPNNFSGSHIAGDIAESVADYGDGENGRKASGLLMVDGVLYMWLRNVDRLGHQCKLAWSSDHGLHWSEANWVLSEFGYCTFINFGQNYSGARDGYVYSVSHDNPSAYTAASHFILMRAPKGQVSNRNAYEFFTGLDGAGNPLWSSDVNQRGAVFTPPAGALRSGISYNAGLGQYLWWQQLPNNGGPDTRVAGGFGVYYAPEPWGPWQRAYYTTQWDMGPGETASFPPKWISSDGRSAWLLFSGDDNFSLRRATFEISGSAPTATAIATATLQPTNTPVPTPTLPPATPTPTATHTPLPTPTQPTSPLPTPTPTQPISPLAAPVAAPVVLEGPNLASNSYAGRSLYMPFASKDITWLEIISNPEYYTLDRDDDGLYDLDEILHTGSDPFKKDRDKNGISDKDEDPDGDGLTNILEITLHHTNPLTPDTDGDSLDDKSEIDSGSDPTKFDTDNDGLADDSEARLGTNVNDADSNNNGVSDGLEIYTSLAATSDGDVVVNLRGVGDIAKQADVRQLADDVRFQQLAGQVGPAILVSTERPVINAQVKLPIDTSQVPGGDTNGLELMRFDEETVQFKHLGRSGANASHVWADSSSVGIFVLIHMPTWEDEWNRNLQIIQNAVTAANTEEDTDGDGLPDALETTGFMQSDGTLVTTDPNAWDTDLDGLSDTEEIGELIEGDSGFHYQVTTNPNTMDTDNDGLLDSEEIDIGTSPNRADTDGDTLSDLLELNNDFDPLDPNPDGDHRRDDVEYANGSEPFYFDPTALIAGQMVLAGLAFGEAGESFVDLGWMEEDTYLSIYYMAGWMVSGFAAVGDVRDAVADAVQGDVGGVALSVLALVPGLGDGSKVATILGKMTNFALERAKGYKVLLPLIRWTMRTFENRAILTQFDLFKKLLQAIGYSQETIDALHPDILKRLAKRVNNPAVINRMLQQGGEIKHFELSGTLYSAIKAKANDASLWKVGDNVAERYSTEAAVQILETEGYEILYVQRNLELFPGGGIHRKGPDIVARKNGKTVIVEVKATDVVGETSFTNSRFKGKLNNVPTYQPSRQWLTTDAERYLDPLEAAALANPNNAKLNDAVQRLDDVANNAGDYEAIIIGFSTNSAEIGRVDDVLDRLTQDATRVHTYLINPQ